MKFEIVKKSTIIAFWAILQLTFVLTVDTSNFTELILEQPDHFVDKSLLIKAILDDKSPIISILRPKLWGKTLNLDMIRKFLQIEVDPEGVAVPRSDQTNRKYFTGFEIRTKLKNNLPKVTEVTAIDVPVKVGNLTHLKLPKKVTIPPLIVPVYPGTAAPYKVTNVAPLKISKVSEAMEHQGIYPVIWLDLEYSKFSTYTGMGDYLKNLVKRIFEQYPYLLTYFKDEGEKNRLIGYLTTNVTTEELSDSIRFLSELLYKHFNRKVYVLVNDYNNPFNLHAELFDSESQAYEKIVNLLKNLFCKAFNNNPYVKKGIFSATIPSTEAYSSVFSHLNNFTEYTLLDDQFSEFYGFTQAEVEELTKRTPPQFVRIDSSELENLYKGYNHGHEIVYNPVSVLRHIECGVNRIPWLQSNTLPHQSISSQLSKETHLQAIRDLVSGYGIVSKIETGICYQNLNDVTMYSALLFAGYLNPNPVEKSNLTYKLTIPNEEIKAFYSNKISNWLREKIAIDVTAVSNFMNMLPICLVDGFKTGYQKLISDITSKLQNLDEIQQEIIHHDLMLMLIDSLSPNYRIDYQKFPTTNETVATIVPRMNHVHNVILIGYKVLQDGQNLTSMANSTLQLVNSLKFDPSTVTCTDIQNIVRVGISIFKWHTAVVHKVESVS